MPGSVCGVGVFLWDKGGLLGMGSSSLCPPRRVQLWFCPATTLIGQERWWQRRNAVTRHPSRFPGDVRGTYQGGRVLGGRQGVQWRAHTDEGEPKLAALAEGLAAREPQPVPLLPQCWCQEICWGGGAADGVGGRAGPSVLALPALVTQCHRPPSRSRTR